MGHGIQSLKQLSEHQRFMLLMAEPYLNKDLRWLLMYNWGLHISLSSVTIRRHPPIDPRSADPPRLPPPWGSCLLASPPALWFQRLRMRTWQIALLSGVLTGTAALVVGLLIGHFAIAKDGGSEQAQAPAQDIDESLIRRFMDQIDSKRIEENLRELSKKPHMATSKGDIDLVNLMLNRWQNKETGLDEAKKVTYNVFLSFPDKNKPNRVSVVAQNGTKLFQSRITELNYTKDQLDPDVVQPFAAFSPAGVVQGKLVFANYGTMDDYHHLNRSIDLNNTIAIVKYGGTGRADKGINGAQFGVIGVIVYTDPADINDGKLSDKNETYPHSWYLPPSGVERGSYQNDFGDLLTPYYPAKDYTFRQAESNIKGLSPIPAQPIGFEDANRLICVTVSLMNSAKSHSVSSPKTKTKARIYPAYHTAYDTFDYASRFIDPGFTSHQTVGRTAGNVLLRLADSAVLPFNIRDYSETIDQLYQAAKENFLTELNQRNISLVPLQSAVTRLREAADGLHARISEMQSPGASPMELRMVNDQLMLLERSFLDPLAFPDKLYYRHVLYASKSSAVRTFPGLADAFLRATGGDSWDNVQKHLTIITHTLEGAAASLEAVI
ncbi:aminopeptidase NAALADL1 [Scyliorhinus canicula]|uniref:aminopeptidase NAALADL1 n=1 Tax=Scyliorhinus canicula TaxID=7830 RepID=UPI0018F5B0F3|nr:aminopeptidase NAALADL1 [Scyliorhinus canicula]